LVCPEILALEHFRVVAAGELFLDLVVEGISILNIVPLAIDIVTLLVFTDVRVVFGVVRHIGLAVQKSI